MANAREAVLDETGVGESSRQETTLRGGHRLAVLRRDEEDVLRVEGGGGELHLEVSVTDSGTTIRLEGADVQIRSSGSLSLDARELAIRGREELSLRSEADLSLEAADVIRSEGHAQQLVARRGDASIYANDDVRLDGERIKMNC